MTLGVKTLNITSVMFNVSRIMTIGLFAISVNSCVSWDSIINCHENAQIGVTTAWSVKKECGRPNCVLRTPDNTVTYSYSQKRYDTNITGVSTIIDFDFSYPSGNLLRTRMYNSDEILPWTCSDPFGESSLEDVPIIKIDK